MNLLSELLGIPGALRELARQYAAVTIPRPARPLLTGMGASYHAGWVGALHLRRAGIDSQYEEAADLLLYGQTALEQAAPLIYLSQSGGSGEVGPLLERLPAGAGCIAITNAPASRLAQAARQRGGLVLPLHAGPEDWIASKTYANTLALVWLLARQWGGAALNESTTALLRLADAAERIQTEREAALARLADLFAACPQVVMIGHGPHAASARHAAMTLSEWPKLVAQSCGVGAYRHGFIESTGAGTGVILFTAAGPGRASTLALGQELQGYGARVLRIEHGQVLDLSAPAAAAAAAPVDEFLSPVLDALPVQLFAEAEARRRLAQPGFRYIQKVVTNL